METGGFLLGASRGDKVGRGCGKQPLICAVERGAPGRCAVRVVEDCRAGTYAAFAEARVDVPSRVAADGWKGIASGLRAWPNLVQRPFDASDPEGSLPAAHRVISNFRAWVQGTFHGLSRTRLQAYADEFSRRCPQRGSGGITTALLRDCIRGYSTIAGLLGSFAPRASGGSVRARGRGAREQGERVRALVEAARAREGA